jgi:phosphohistidine phosphatase
MRHLMLLRHAKTEKDSPSGNDRDRRLNARGREDAPALGRYIAAQDLVPQLVLVSPATRARQTWELVAEELQSAPPHEVVHDLYGADARQLLHIARAATQLAPRVSAGRLMIVGHNPGLHEFALALARTSDAKSSDRSSAKAQRALTDNLPTSGLAVIVFSMTDWADLSFGRGRLERLVSPALLREDTKES